MPRMIDLGSDTSTRPSQAMLAFMMGCSVGDDQKREDPTVNALQERVAALLGLEAGLFLPSATMANEIAVKVHTQPGDEIILDRESHFVTSEAGGPALLSGVMTHLIAGERGIFTVEEAEAGIRRAAIHSPQTRMISVEQTTNRGGGAVWPVDTLRGMAAMARQRGIGLHMDGSRLMHAVVASGKPAAVHVSGFDSVSFCLSKGLGCPVGALLMGSRDFIEKARRYKHVFGGAMRQSGIIAGAGLYALDHNVDRLADDHRNAKLLAGRLALIPGVSVDVDKVETNILFFDVTGPGPKGKHLTDLLEARGVRMGAWSNETRIRAVTHLDVSSSDIDAAAAIVADVLANAPHERL